MAGLKRRQRIELLRRKGYQLGYKDGIAFAKARFKELRHKSREEVIETIYVSLPAMEATLTGYLRRLKRIRYQGTDFAVFRRAYLRGHAEALADRL